MARIDVPDGEGDEVVRVWGAEPVMGGIAATFSAKVYEHSQVAVRERELVRMRVALLNACPVCLDTRAAEAEQHGLTEADYAAVEQWRESDRFTPREKVAIEYAERFVADHLSMDDEFWARLRSHWDDPEILDLSVCIASFLGLGRLTQVLDPQHSCPLEI